MTFQLVHDKLKRIDNFDIPTINLSEKCTINFTENIKYKEETVQKNKKIRN